MEGQNEEQKDIQSEISEETVSDLGTTCEDAAEPQEENITEKLSDGKVSFGKSLMAILIDEVAIFVISYIGLYLVDFILRKVAGLYIVQKFYMLFILFVVVSILYTSILESVKGNTIGKKIANLKINNA